MTKPVGRKHAMNDSQSNCAELAQHVRILELDAVYAQFPEDVVAAQELAAIYRAMLPSTVPPEVTPWVFGEGRF